MNLKQLYQKSTVLPGLILFTYLCLFLETIKYPGFIGNHLFIDVKVYFALTIFLILFSDTKSKVLAIILKINRLILLPLFLVYFSLSLLEGAHYTNYVLAIFHIHLDGLVLLVLFSLFIFLVDKFKDIVPKVKGKIGFIYLTMVFLIILFMVKNIAYVADNGFNRNSYILFHLNSSYDERMFYQWGIFYQYMVFVKNNTPLDATVVVPPEQDPWLMGTGNYRFVRAFLYPRKIIPETLIIPDVKTFGPNTFILISWGQQECKPEGCHGWPRQNIFAKKIFYKDPESSKVIETRENTNYKLEDDKYVYGIIEI